MINDYQIKKKKKRERIIKLTVKLLKQALKCCSDQILKWMDIKGGQFLFFFLPTYTRLSWNEAFSNGKDKT